MTNTERTYIAETLEQLMYRSAEEGYTGERDALTYAIINLNKTTWIPVKERLPEKTGAYLVTCANGNIKCGHFTTFGNTWTDAKAVAWMPLPDMYEEDSE